MLNQSISLKFTNFAVDGICLYFYSPILVQIEIK